MYAFYVKGKSIYKYKNLENFGINPKTQNAAKRPKESQRNGKQSARTFDHKFQFFTDLTQQSKEKENPEGSDHTEQPT